MSGRRSDEDKIHAAIVQHLDVRGVPGLVYFHPPNAPRNAVTGARLKRLGMKAGVADLILLHNGRAHALELKTEIGRTTPAQRQFAVEWKAAGGYHFVAQGLDPALNWLKAAGLIQ